MAVVRAEVTEAELLEQRPGDDHVLEHRFHIVREAVELPADERDAVHDALREILRLVVALPLDDRVQIARHGADIRRDRHVVVIEDDHQFPFEVARLVDTFEREAAGERAVADDRDDPVVLFAKVAGDGDAEGRGDRGRGMAGVEDVVLRLFALAEAGDAVVLPDGGERLAAAGDQFVRIRLMAGIEHDLVARGVEDVMQRQRQLDDAEVAAEVAADLRHHVDDRFADLLRHLRELSAVEFAQVGGSVDAVEKSRHEFREQM